MNEARRDALARVRRQNPDVGNKKAAKPAPAPAPAAPELHEEELEHLLIPEDQASQIGEANLKPGDVVIYLRAVTFKPEVLKNIARRGPTALLDYAAKQPAYFLITREEYAPDVLKGLLQANINPPTLKEDQGI